jgi:hypothetical protein
MNPTLPRVETCSRCFSRGVCWPWNPAPWHGECACGISIAVAFQEREAPRATRP